MVYPVDQLSISGGCANNSVANGKIYANTPFKKVYVQPAAGDAGGAIGAAFELWHRSCKTRTFSMTHSYWGPSFPDNNISNIISGHKVLLDLEGCTIEAVPDINLLCKKVAKDISNGLVIGWFQDRMEWGPRALGNRSILGDPRRKEMKEILNEKIKRRESFRPFAPSILENKMQDWFYGDDHVPFMMQVYSVKEEKRSLIPAVTHHDGSGRLQTVTKQTNFKYYTLIEEFYRITDVPILLNTSFNENEPVVCTPEEAISCFLRTKMDVLVIGDWYISR